MFKKIISFSLAVAMVITAVVAFVSCNGTEEDVAKKGLSEDVLAITVPAVDFTVPETFKIGLIALHDENSTYDKNFIDGLLRVKAALKLTDAQVLIKTNIAESNDCYVAAKELADAGCNIIFADSFGHESFMIQAAKEYPNIQFCHATGTKAHVENLPNYHNAFAAIYEGRYLAGIAAGLKLNEMINDGKITADQAVMGYVGAFTYAEVVSGFTSFYLGAKSVCPSVTMKVKYTGSWYDPSSEQETAIALIESGCVLISQHADSLGAPTACELKGVPNISYNGSTFSAGPESFLVSSAINWSPYFMYIIKSFSEGTAIMTDYCGDINSGSIVVSHINLDVAAEGTKEAIDKAVNQFKNNTLKVFDVAKDNYITVNGAKLTEWMADIDGDNTPDTNVVKDGYIDESGAAYRSAPFFSELIDGITNINVAYGD